MPQRCESGSRCFHLVLIKPSHYDDDGYPIQWVKAAIPSNTLRLPQRAGGRRQASRGARARHRDPPPHVRRDQPAGPARSHHPRDPPRGRRRADRDGRGAVEPVSPRRRSGAAVSGRRPAGVHRRVSRVGLDRDAARDAAGNARGAGARHLVLCRRSRAGPARRGVARRQRRRAASRSTISWTICRRSKASRRRCCRHATSAGSPVRCRASISGAAAPTNARSARSSTCRGARAGFAPPTISNARSARITRKASSGSSSPTTISRATGIGRRCSTG